MYKLNEDGQRCIIHILASFLKIRMFEQTNIAAWWAIVENSANNCMNGETSAKLELKVWEHKDNKTECFELPLSQCFDYVKVIED